MLVDHVAQRFAARRQRFAPVVVPEERGVREPRPDLAFVAVAHPVRRLALEIRDRDESGQQRTVIVGDREVPLVARQRRDDDFAR